MTDPQLTTVWVILVGTLGLGLVFYPGVRSHGASRRNSFWAAFMAALLCAVALGLMAGAVHNGFASFFEV
jgi:hypothetical protein